MCNSETVCVYVCVCVCVCVHMCVRAWMQRVRDRGKREVSGKKERSLSSFDAAPFSPINRRENDRSAYAYSTFHPRAVTSSRPYESLVVNRSDVMQESINRIPFTPFSESVLFLSLCLSPDALSRPSQPPRDDVAFFYFSASLIHLPEKQPRNDAPLRAVESCVTSSLERGSHPPWIFIHRHVSNSLFKTLNLLFVSVITDNFCSVF